MKTIIKKIFIILGLFIAIFITFYIISTLKTSGVEGLKNSFIQTKNNVLQKIENIKEDMSDFGADMLNVESSDGVKVNITGTSGYEVTTGDKEIKETKEPEPTATPKVLESEIHELF